MVGCGGVSCRRPSKTVGVQFRRALIPLQPTQMAIPHRWKFFPKTVGRCNKAQSRAENPHMHFKEQTLSLNRSEKEAVINEVTSLAAKAQTLVIAGIPWHHGRRHDQTARKARSKGV